MPQYFSALLSVLVVSLSCLAGDWNQWRGPGRNGLDAASPKLLGRLPADGLRPVWVAKDIPAAGWGSPAVAEGRVFLLTHTRKQKPESEFPPRRFPELAKEKREAMPKEELDAYEKNRADEERERRKQDELTETVWCLDASDGNVVWKKAIPSVHTSFPHSNTPAVVDGKLYLLGAGRKGRCLDAGTGEVAWEVTLPGSFNDEHLDSSFAVGDGVALVQAGPLFALDARTGDLLWQSKKGDNVESSPAIWNSGSERLAVANIGGGITAAFDLHTGADRWHVESQANVSSPVISGDSLVTLGDQPQAGLRCFKMALDKAEPVWTVPQIADRGSSPVVVGQHVFAQGERKLVCVDLESGKKLWQARLSQANPQYTSLAAADGKVFYTHDGVMAFAADGAKHHVLFTAKLNQDGLLADEATHRRLLGLDELELADGGSEKARQKYQAEVLSQGPLDCASPALANGKLYLRLRNGLACYDLRTQDIAAK